jgi:peptidase M28-like protein
VTAVPGIGRVSGLIAALALAGSAQAQNPPLPAGVEQAAHAYITRPALEAPIRFLSSDLLEGRGPATRGDELARLYLQTRLGGMGYQHAFAKGAWQQPFDIAVSGVQKESVSIDDAELVFVGYGIQAPEFRWDDFKGAKDAVRRLMKSGGHDLDKLIASARSRDFHPVPLGIRTSISFTNRLASVQTANVGGVLPGSDPKLRAQVVVLSAHHDHFGIGEPDASGDGIYHGAVDNASGCAQVLAIAQALASLPERPRRSVLALFVAGEERGLLGSKYYAEHPTFAAGRIAADINVDDGNIFGRTRDATSIALGKSSLDEVAARVAATQGRVVKGDQFPDRGYYYRSDQLSFARIGVPALFFDDGADYIGRPAGWGRQQKEQWELKKYHQPSDRLEDSWNFDGMIEDEQLAMLSAWLTAQADAMPTWKPGDEFEAARKRALAAAGGS